jgi:glucokinase
MIDTRDRERCFAGFDLGGTELKYGLVGDSGKILWEARIKTPGSMESLLLTLQDIWTALKNKKKDPVQAAGFGFPGIFSVKEQKILQSPNYPDIDNFPLLPTLSRFVDLPFWVNNDANMAAFGEYKCGAGLNAHSLVLLTIGTGVGSGIILNGQIWEGTCGFAGEMGHVVVNPEGDPCNCGSQGCLETEVSAHKIVKNYLALAPSQSSITAKEISRRAHSHDEAAQQAFSQAGRYLGIGLSIAINLLNPEMILLGGGVMEAGDFLLSPAREEAARRSFKHSYLCCSIERATLGNKGGFIGAALWAKEKSSSSSD